MGLSQQQLNDDLDALARRDPSFAKALATLGPPPTRHREPGFATLLAVIVSQQLSTRAAATIWQRVQAGLGEVPTPEAVLATTQLREWGLSGRKAEYAKDLAAHVATGALDFALLPQLDDDSAVEKIVAVRGLGRWSAQIYLMFAEGRRDMWPADDLAIQKAYAQLKGLEASTLRGKKFEALTQDWSPYRSAAALMMWHCYGSTTLEASA